MLNPKPIVICVLLTLGTAMFGGCPAVTPDGGFQSAVTGSDSGANGQSATNAPGDHVLGELVTNLAEADAGNELASSESSGFVAIGSDDYPEGVYPPGYNPFANDEGGDGTSGGQDHRGGGGSGDDGGGGAASGGGNDGPTGHLYHGSVDCVRSESLLGYGGLSENLTYYVGFRLDDAGVPDAISIPMFITKNLYKASVVQPGQSGVHDEVFAPSGAAFTVTVTVRSATYTPSGMHVVYDIDVKWIGAHSGITATGTHTVDTQLVDGSFTWSSTTHYDALMWADEDWKDSATEDFVCSGTLSGS